MKRIIALLIALLFCLIVITMARAQSDPAYVKNMENPTAQKIEEDLQDYLYDKIDLLIPELVWCFTADCSNQLNVEIIGKLLEQYGYTEETYGVGCKKDDGFIELRIVMVSNVNPDHRFMHLWFLEADDSIDVVPEDLGGII